MDKSDLLIFVNILLGLVAFFGAKVGSDLKSQIPSAPKEAIENL